MPPTKTITELEKELAAKQEQLDKLQVRRKDLAAKIETVDKQIEQLAGEAPASTTRRRKKTTQKVARRKAARKTSGRKAAPKGARRGTRAKPLPEYIRQVLAGAAEGMRVKDIAAAARQAGYSTRSKHFYESVAAALREMKDVERVQRGVYRLKG